VRRRCSCTQAWEQKVLAFLGHSVCFRSDNVVVCEEEVEHKQRKKAFQIPFPYLAEPTQGPAVGALGQRRLVHFPPEGAEPLRAL
jgi:hypothetical protein